LSEWERISVASRSMTSGLLVVARAAGLRVPQAAQAARRADFIPARIAVVPSEPRPASSAWRRCTVESEGTWSIRPVATSGSRRSTSFASSPPRASARARVVMVWPVVWTRFGFCRSPSSVSIAAATPT